MLIFRSCKSSTSNLLKKIEEHQLKNDTLEWQKQQEYNVRRKRRKEIRKIMESKSTLQSVKKLYVASFVLVCVGIIMIFGATIRTLSDGSVLWTYREQFVIAGPFVTGLGIVLLLVTVGLESSTEKKIVDSGELDRQPFIHPDFKLEKGQKNFISRQDSVVSSCSSSNRNTPGRDKARRKWYETQSSCEEEFLCSSIASTNSTFQGIDITTRWAKAMAFTIDESGCVVDNSTKNKTDGNKPSSEFSKVDGDTTRLISNAPTIKITDMEREAVVSKSSSLTSLSKLKPCDHEKEIKRAESDKNLRHDYCGQKNGNLAIKDAKLHGISEESVSHVQNMA